jgi:hypothetical protein
MRNHQQPSSRLLSSRHLPLLVDLLTAEANRRRNSSPGISLAPSRSR